MDVSVLEFVVIMTVIVVSTYLLNQIARNGRS